VPSRIHLGFVLRISFVVSLSLLFWQSADAATATFRVGTVQVSPGSTVDVPIEVVGAPGIGPLHLELTYDSSVVAAQEVVRGPMLSNALMETNVAARGRVVMAIVSADAIKGDGVVLKVRFKGLGSQGQASALTLEGVKAWERGNGRDILVKTEAGRATIAADYSMWLLLGAACLCLLVLFAVAVLLFLLLRRRAASHRPA
jgi:hypothetical protein